MTSILYKSWLKFSLPILSNQTRASCVFNGDFQPEIPFLTKSRFSTESRFLTESTFLDYDSSYRWPANDIRSGYRTGWKKTAYMSRLYDIHSGNGANYTSCGYTFRNLEIGLTKRNLVEWKQCQVYIARPLYRFHSVHVPYCYNWKDRWKLGIESHNQSI